MKAKKKMIDLIVRWAFPAFMGSFLTYIGTLIAKNRALKSGLQCLLRAEIIRSFDKYTQKGEIPIYAREALVKEYKAYHKLGGNDVATDLYHKTLKLPTK